VPGHVPPLAALHHDGRIFDELDPNPAVILTCSTLMRAGRSVSPELACSTTWSRQQASVPAHLIERRLGRFGVTGLAPHSVRCEPGGNYLFGILPPG